MRGKGGENMTVGGLTEYLSQFSPEEPVSIVVIDLDRGKCLKACDCRALDGGPVLLLETSEAGALNGKEGR